MPSRMVKLLLYYLEAALLTDRLQGTACPHGSWIMVVNGNEEQYSEDWEDKIIDLVLESHNGVLPQTTKSSSRASNNLFCLRAGLNPGNKIFMVFPHFRVGAQREGVIQEPLGLNLRCLRATTLDIL